MSNATARETTLTVSLDLGDRCIHVCVYSIPLHQLTGRL